MKKIDIATIPELNTSVGMYGSARLKDVGGGPCLATCLLVALIIAI